MTPGKQPTAPLAAAELTILKALWDAGPGTVREVQSRLPGSDRAYTTVQTLLQRLLDKGYVAVDRRGAAHVYAAAVTRDQVAGQQVDEVASNVLEGATGPLLLHLAQKARFTPAEIARFRALLDAAERRARGGRGRPGPEAP